MKAFKNIIGYENIKKELYYVIDMVKNIDKYESMGARLPKGILLYGEPGLGKTMLAKAFIKECNVKTFVIDKRNDHKTLLDKIENVFDEASTCDKGIIFIDDIDKFCEETEGVYREKEAFTVIQNRIDGIKDKNIIIVATANNYKKLPTSLKRSGRFDIKILVEHPTNSDGRKITEYYLKSKKVDKNLNYDDVSKMICYVSCAELEKIINESAIYAAYENKEYIDINDIVKAYLKTSYNIGDDESCVDSDDLYKTALHEAGHAVIAEAIKKGSVGLLSINTSTNSIKNGFTKLCEDLSRRPEKILMTLGGKAAVELFYQGRSASGCSMDLHMAATYIRDGLSNNVNYGLGLLDPTTSQFEHCSENYNSRVESVIHAELERFMFVCKDILLKNKDFLVKLAEELFNKKTLLNSDIKRIRESCKVVDYVA